MVSALSYEELKSLVEGWVSAGGTSVTLDIEREGLTDANVTTKNLDVTAPQVTDLMVDKCAGIPSIPANVLLALPNLETLMVAECSTFPAVETLKQLRSLKKIHFWGPVHAIPSNVGELDVLEELEVNGGAISTVPEGLAACPNLRKLSICNNSNLRDPLPAALLKLEQQLHGVLMDQPAFDLSLVTFPEATSDTFDFDSLDFNSLPPVAASSDDSVSAGECFQCGQSPSGGVLRSCVVEKRLTGIPPGTSGTFVKVPFRFSLCSSQCMCKVLRTGDSHKYTTYSSS
eukprot:GFYU01000520.1.p1 GENE.GFYU01000520.1~~GFYU01000520.1.p1  ORF type:complete len:287 (-),score=52.41 GFYU01000520.1:320-1180(-)